jgi:D-glycero-alpha-D-manno-heptose-7-phosphate kinase
VRQRAKAPTRVDLAGGTLDIWPLWNIIPGSITVNVAIQQYTTVTVDDKGKSDEGFPRFIAENIAEACGLKEIPAIKIKADYPTRMGLGGSSSALITSLWCFEYFRKLPVKELIQACANLESRFLKTSTGMQDYYPPLLGGVHAIHFDYQGPRHEQLKPGKKISDILKNGITLVRGRGQHASGNINWQVVKNAVDGDETTLSILRRYAAAGKKARESIIEDDANGLFNAINEDMQARMELGEMVVPNYFKDLYENIRKLSPFAGKICGAGGDSCLALFHKPQDAELLKSYLKSKGWEILPTSLSTTGVVLDTQ